MDKREAAGDIFPWDGTLTSSDFFLAAHMFSDNWRKFNTSVPPWLWVKCPKRYLVSSNEGAESDYLEINHYDFHIVYSASYRVPVLYFRAYHSDGQPLLLSEIEKGLPGHSVKLLSESKWTFITQEEHPYLNRPWCKLHPCGTSEWMKLLFSSDKSLTTNGLKIEHYLVSWFSVIGQVVGLKIPLEMMDFGC
ncbi:ubiquitin-like-conjugating enzyme ATG10 isoform X3 [Prosopis cineraria]|uniref:ubiquitin-like-conjugating enzyme ATG10 isoform X3 n=1 Tax=Prosopis cineraria TaxID=364024 RepID=UPI00240F396B|nr:ubiquitin-like-conjugating enzyme ATG10 isoform X3 [Prosopis cineraria]